LTTTLRPDRKEIPPRLATDVDAGGGVGNPRQRQPCEALHWLLWTREPATTLVEVQEVVPEIHLPLADRGVSLDAEERLSYRGPSGWKKWGQFGKGGS